MAKGVGFKESVTAFRTITQDVKSGRLAPAYLLMGEEGYFIDRLGDMLADNVLTEEEKAFNRIVAYGKDSDVEQLMECCRTMPMMGGRQVVVVREAQQLKKIEQFSVYMKSPSASTILVLCHKEKNMDKRSPLYKSIAQKGVVLESVRPRDYEIGPWLAEFIRSKGCTIDPKALNMLTEHLGVDISKISNELDKLLTFLPEGTNVITADHIEQNIGISKDFNTFELTKAISMRDTGKALLIATHFAHNPGDHPLNRTIISLFGHFQRIFILNYQKWLAAKKGIAMPQEMELSRMLNLSSAFFLKEYQTASANYPNRKVFTILGLLREYDMKSKGMNNGGADDGELLRELLMRIFTL